jgi:hypothetical protein
VMEMAGELLDRIHRCIEAGEVRVSSHGYDELAADGLFFEDVLAGFANARVIEGYPDYPKGPCLLMLQTDPAGAPVHVLWGIPKGHRSPSVLITAYRPDPERWDETFTRRKP